MAHIPLHDPRSFTHKYMPSATLQANLKGLPGFFFIIRLEDMYRHVHKAVPPTRSVTHSCLFITGGEANMKIGDAQYTVAPQELLFVPAGSIFSFHEKDEATGYIFNFHDELLAGKYAHKDLLHEFEFLKVWGHPLIRPDESTAASIRYILERLLAEFSENGLQHLNIIQPWFVTLLCEVNRVYQPAPQQGNSTATGITNRFRELLVTHIKNCRLVADFAAQLNITPNHLNKSVKAVTGKSPTRWIDETIVLEAKALLSQSEFTISEVAAAVGIDDQSYFTRLFRKYAGLTPTAFRKGLKNPTYSSIRPIPV